MTPKAVRTQSSHCTEPWLVNDSNKQNTVSRLPIKILIAYPFRLCFVHLYHFIIMITSDEIKVCFEIFPKNLSRIVACMDAPVTAESVKEKLARIDALKRRLKQASGGKPAPKPKGKPAQLDRRRVGGPGQRHQRCKGAGVGWQAEGLLAWNAPLVITREKNAVAGVAWIPAMNP